MVLDLLDGPAVRERAAAARPDAIVHQATALTGLSDFTHFDRSFARTNRLRTEGTELLPAAAREAGVRRFVAQSSANHRYARDRGAGEDGGRSPRPDAGAGDARDGSCDAVSGSGGHGRGDAALPKLATGLRRRLRGTNRRDAGRRSPRRVRLTCATLVAYTFAGFVPGAVKERQRAPG